MTEHATVSEDGAVIVVTFHRPAQRNALDDGMIDAIREAATELAERPDLRVLLVRAEGPWFTAGIDLHSGWSSGLFDERPVAPGGGFRRQYRKLHLLYDELEAIEKPIVLAAQGSCWGAGMELACSVDFRLAADAATFSLPEVRFGAVAGSGGASRLTRLVGPHWAKWISMAGQAIDAETALRIGFVHEVTPIDDFDARALGFCRELAELPPDAVGLSKLLIDAAVDTDRTTQRHLDRIAVTTLYGGDEVAAYRARFTRSED